MRSCFAGCDPNTINVTKLRIPGSRIFILKGPARPRSSLTKYFNPMKREEWWKMIAIVNTTIFNCFDNLIKWSGDQCESHLHIKIFVLRRWNVTDDPGLIDISDAYHLTSFYVILLHNFCSDSSRSGPDDFQETSICFLRHFQIIRFVIAWWGRAGSDFLWLAADKTGAQHSQWSTEQRLWHLVVS